MTKKNNLTHLGKDRIAANFLPTPQDYLCCNIFSFSFPLPPPFLVPTTLTLPFTMSDEDKKKSKTIGDYRIGKVLGTGSYGYVRLGVNIITGEQV
jgi:hypothetical protein